jgi:hypothetical protein
MIDIKNNFLGGMDLDTSYHLLPKNAYVDALNISRDAVDGSQDMAITNFVGNRLVDHNYGSNGKVIGAVANTIRNTVVFLRYSETGYHGIYEYNNDTRIISPIFLNLTDSADVDVLGFTEHEKITSINVLPRDEGDLLYFLDSLKRPTGLNITRFKAGEYTPVTREILDVAKCPPLAPPEAVYDNDTTRRSNNTRNKLFRFKYRWVYDDNEKSSTSPISAVPLPVSILDDTYTNVVTNNNVIRLSLNSGDKNVKAVELFVSVQDHKDSWADFALVTSVNKADESLTDNADFAYAFYNDSTYPYLDINESTELFDYVPDEANAQELVNGNVLVYVGITEGYDKNLTPNVDLAIDTVAAGSGGSVGSLNGIPYNTGTNIGFETVVGIGFSGIPATGTLITVKSKNIGTGLTTTVGSYTTVAGDTPTNVASAIGTSLDLTTGFGLPNPVGGTIEIRINYTMWQPIVPGGTYLTVEITPPVSSADHDSIGTWKWSTERNIGLQYFDKKGKTNGVLYNEKVTFPAYAENGTQQPLLPFINAKIYHTPPEWAYSYQWVITKEPTKYLFWHVTNVNTDETNYIYFDVSNIALNATKTPSVASVLEYTFQEGDRLRLIRDMTDDTVYTDVYDAAIEGLVVDPKINGVATTGTFIKIKKVFPFDTLITAFTHKFFVVELYRPGQSLPNQENAVYYEFGEQYMIGNPTLETRYHKGMVTDQNGATPAEFNFYNGDSYFRRRSVYISDNGFGTFYVQDRNFVDFLISAVSSLDGRPTLIDVNARRAYYSTLIRFGQAYQPNTNINGLNRFYAANFDEYDYSFGDVMRLKVRDRYLRVYQKYKVGTVPVYNQIMKDPQGATIAVVTDKLLNPIQYYSGNYGIGDNSESLASVDFADYFTSNIKGVICRVSQDGVTPISVTGKINSWATDKLPLRKGNYKVYGAFDQKLNNYICALEATDTDEAQTIIFDEEANNFDGFVSYHPEMMITLGVLLISFKNGHLYTHDNTTYNNFYGVQYDSYIKPVFNDNTLVKKSYQAITEVSNRVWDCPEIKTSLVDYGSTQQSNLVADDFEDLEGQYHACFLRDENSVGGVMDGNPLKGGYISIKFRVQNASELSVLNTVSVKYILSHLNNK